MTKLSFHPKKAKIVFDLMLSAINEKLNQAKDDIHSTSNALDIW